MAMKGALAAAITLLTLAANANADDDEPKTKPDAHAPDLERTFGFGTILGGGFTVATLTTSTGSASSGLNGALLLPTIEIEAFVTPSISVDVSVPLTNVVIASLVIQGVAFSGQAIVQVSVGDGDVRGVFGAGIGGDFVSAGSVSGAAASSSRARSPSKSFHVAEASASSCCRVPTSKWAAQQAAEATSAAQ